MPNALIKSLNLRDRLVLFMILSSNGLFWVAVLWLVSYTFALGTPVWMYAACWAVCVLAALWLLGRFHDMKEPY